MGQIKLINWTESKKMTGEGIQKSKQHQKYLGLLVTRTTFQETKSLPLAAVLYVATAIWRPVEIRQIIQMTIGVSS